MHSKVFRPLNFFHILLLYSLILKWRRKKSLINPHTSLHSYFQASPEMLVRVEVRALAVPLKDIQGLVPKSLQLCAVVLLEGEPSPQSEVLSTLEQVFIKDLPALCSVHLALDPD